MGSEWDVSIWTKDHGFPIDEYRDVIVESGEGMLRMCLAFWRARKHKRPVTVTYRGWSS